MNDRIKLRCIKFGQYILKNNETIRGVAKHFNISKSTVHYDLSKRLMKIDNSLYKRVKYLLDVNFSEKHIRGGMSTRQKYKNKKYV